MLFVAEACIYLLKKEMGVVNCPLSISQSCALSARTLNFYAEALNSIAMLFMLPCELVVS